jgi:hypothetical protein
LQQVRAGQLRDAAWSCRTAQHPFGPVASEGPVLLFRRSGIAEDLPVRRAALGRNPGDLPQPVQPGGPG